MKVWAIDLKLLKLTRAAIELCDEWLSLSQARIEQVLGIAFLVLDAVGWALAHPCVFRSIGLACIPVNLLWVWVRYRSTAAARGSELLYSVRALVFRLAMLWITVSTAGMSLLYRNLDLIDLAGLVLVAFIYVTALPHDEGSRRGRKAKLALAKLKEMFGTSWMPAPQGGPA